MRMSVATWSMILIASSGLTGRPGQAAVPQDVAVSVRTPRFLYVASKGAKPIEIDADRSAVLQRVVSLQVTAPTVGKLLHEIERQTGLTFLYDATLPVNHSITLDAKSITVASALAAILHDIGVDVVMSPGGYVGLVDIKSGLWPRGALMGRVTDSASGGAVVGAEVFLENTHWRARTDSAGWYALPAVDAGTYTLTVRNFGYAPRSRTVKVAAERTDTIDIALAPIATPLNELVSTATGQRRRVDIANDITTINADSVVRTQPITSVTDLLENRVPGLTVQRTSGAPGDPARLRLRGAGSPLQNNDPIVIVDGVRVYAKQSTDGGANLASALTTGITGTNPYAVPSPLDYIDPNTIEKVEVLKGPSAATLYGPDAANGVIVITTKKGKAGPPRWTFRADHGTSRVPGSFPDLTIRWGHTLYHPDVHIVCGTGDIITGLGSGNTGCTADSVATYQMLNDPALTVLDQGNQNTFTLGVSGGTQTLTYAVTGSYQRQVGLFKLPGYEVDQYVAAHDGQAPPDWTRRPQQLTQWGVTSNLTAHLGASADVTLTSKFSSTAQQRSSLEHQLGTIWATFYDRASDTYYYVPATGSVIAQLPPSQLDILNSYYERATESALQFTNGLQLSWRPRAWLTLSGDAGLDVQQREDETLLPRNAVNVLDSPLDAADSVGALASGHRRVLTSTVNLRSVAVVPVGLGLHLNLAAGVNYTDNSLGDLALASRWLPVGTTLLGDSVTAKSRTATNDATFGWYLEQSLNHRKFSLSTGLRLDGGSNYGTRVSTSGGLPKLGFSYLVSDEPFFPFKNLFQSFRVRASYGRAGRQPGITDRLRLYSVATTATVADQSVAVSDLASLGNTELRPERTSEFEGGFDADLLDGRLSLTTSWYRKTTDDALLPVPVAPSVYGTSVNVMKNIGVIRNTGIEATLTTQWVRSRSVSLGTDLLVSHNRSLVVKLAPGVLPFWVSNTTVNSGELTNEVRVAPGYPLFSRWTKPILGYADANGNGALEASEVVLGDTSVYMGSSLPTYQVDFATNLSVLGGAVTMSVGLHYDDGFTQLDELSQSLAPFAVARNSDAATLADQAAVTDVRASSYNWYQTVHVVRVQSVSLGYRMPAALAQRVGAQQMSVALQGRNLGLWTNYRGLDPNVNASPTGNAAVVDTGVLPQPRTWRVQVSATY